MKRWIEMLLTSDLIFQNIEEWELSFIEYWFLKYESEVIPEIRKQYNQTLKELVLTNCMLLPEHYPLLQLLAKDLNRSTIQLVSRDDLGFEDTIRFVNGSLVRYELGNPSNQEKN